MLSFLQYCRYDSRFIHLKLKLRYAHLDEYEQSELELLDYAIQQFIRLQKLL
mgnify:CR=1 FL=1